MAPEIGNFKGRLFGGFDRKDVIAYIEESAAELESLEAENEKLRGTVAELEARIQEMEEAAKAVPSPEEVAAECDARCKVIMDEYRAEMRSLRTEYGTFYAELRTNVAQADHELSRVTGKLAGLQSALNAGGVRLAALLSNVDHVPAAIAEAREAKRMAEAGTADGETEPAEDTETAPIEGDGEAAPAEGGGE